MPTDFLRPARNIHRLILHRKHWRYDSVGYCASCGSLNIFVHAFEQKAALAEFIEGWSLSDNFKKQLLERENYMCIYCLANYRQRVHAETVLFVLNLARTGKLIAKLKSDTSFKIYETAAYSVFKNDALRNMVNYVVSEYFDDRPFGTCVNGIRNENLEQLTFPDNSFDVLINSDVLEHVSDLNKALSEIKRVLKPGGFHVFTLPVDYELPKTTERAVLVDGKIKHIMKPVMHGDTIRGSGILAFRDFGKNVLEYMSRAGLECKELKYFKGNEFITSVYYAKKIC